MIASIKAFLNKPIPERIGWPHIFGSMLLSLLTLQFLTGILLSFVYSSSPDSAWKSVRYISEQMPGGWWIRGIHFWGASLIIVVLALHLLRTFVYAAYKSPRQFTWVVGVLLLLVMLAFAQTGYLLPWDQKAYWGTNVTIEIIRSAPVLGPYLGDFLRGGNAVGALTLSRFFTIHVVLLPLALVILAAVHLYLIQRHGITVPWRQIGELDSRTKPFHPEQSAKDSTGMLFIIAFTLVLAYLLPSPLGNPADPTDNTFVPRPDWYFLFLFQTLTYFKGHTELLGTFILPNLAILALLFLPFYDRNPNRNPGKRPFALAVVVLCLIGWAYLTHAAIEETPKIPAWHPIRGMEPPRAERIKRPSEVGGMSVMQQYCFGCHSMTVLGPRPSLQMLARKNFPIGKDWLQDHLKRSGKEVLLTKKDTEMLMSALRVTAGDRPDLLYTIPPHVRDGGRLFYNGPCTYCHKVDGQGGDQTEVKAPDLTFRLLRKKEWHVQHIKDPRTVVPNSEMPPNFHYSASEFDALAEYLWYLHKP